MPKYELGFRMRFMLWVLNFVKKPASSLTMKQIRRQRKPFPIGFLARWVLGRGPDLADVKESSFPARDGHEVPIRIYRPSEQDNLPLILNFHGGGWVLGNLDQSDHYCRSLAKKCEALVISVDYRLAPENKFPIPLQDCYDSLCWAAENAVRLGIDLERIAVTGDSAGGNLSAAVSLMSRDLKGPKIAFQALVYPATNGKLDYPSFAEHVKAPILSKADVLFYMNAYKKEPDDHLKPYFSPYLAEDLSQLPPALVITAGYDPLRDDGRQYGQRLIDSGNEVVCLDFPKEIHGFITLVNHSPRNAEAIEQIAKHLQRAFGS